MDTLLLDLRYALRRLVAVPGFTIGAVLSLGLGIGASTVIFSAVNGVVLRPLPYPGADRLVFLPREGEAESDVSIPDAVDWRARSQSFDAIATFAPGMSFDLLGDGEPERLNAAVAEPDYFDVIGVRPLAGRVYTAAENVSGVEQVAVLGEGLWRRRFASDPNVVGRTITLSDKPTRVIGVLAASADVAGLGIDLYLPPATATPWAMHERGTNHLQAIGRLKPGVTLGAAQVEMRTITRALAADYPRTNGGKVIVPVDLRTHLVGNVRLPLFILLGSIALVLLITCINLANFLLARAAGRRQELAVRLALGAGRARLLRQLLAESMTVALLGGLAGVGLAVWGRDLLMALGPDTLPRVGEVKLDWAVLAFALALALAAGFFVGLAPALEAFRGAPAEALGGGNRGTAGRWRGRRLDVLAAAQVALAVVLVVGASLLTRSFSRLLHARIGFDPSNVLVADVVLPGARYGGKRELQSQAYRAMVEEVSRIPGVAHAAFVIGPPLNSSQIGHTVLMDDRPHTGDHDGVGARVRPILGDYFPALGIPILKGRAFTAADDAGAARVVIVNERFARDVWPGLDPIGRRLAFRLEGDSLIWRTVVGVAGDVRSSSMADADSRAVYEPYLQRDVVWQTFGSFVLKTRSDPLAAARPLAEAVWRVDPRLPVGSVTPMTRVLAHSIARQRFSAGALGGFAVAALLIAMQGIYAVLAYAVAMRRREIGIRLALGAERRRVVQLVLRRGAAAAGMGLVAGLVAALALSRLLRTVLYETTPTDFVSYVAAALLLGGVAACASWLPARRAAGTDPMIALRSE
jgi:predicted permease